MIRMKIKEHEIDHYIARILLKKKGEWTVTVSNKLGDIWLKKVPFYYAPLSGDINIENREIKLSDSKNTYLLATFFLPWADKLCSSKNKETLEAINEIEREFSGLYESAINVLTAFSNNPPFHPFIEGDSSQWNKNKAKEASQLFDNLKVQYVLTEDTRKIIKNYLDQYEFENGSNKWQNIKEQLEVRIEDLVAFFVKKSKDYPSYGPFAILPKNERTKKYVDKKWLIDILTAILENLPKAFKEGSFSGQPKVTIPIEFGTINNKKALIIEIKDNGVGFNVHDKTSWSGLKKFFSAEGRRLLSRYGYLSFESKEKKLIISSEFITSDYDGNPLSSDIKEGDGTRVKLVLYTE